MSSVSLEKYIVSSYESGPVDLCQYYWTVAEAEAELLVLSPSARFKSLVVSTVRLALAARAVPEATDPTVVSIVT